MMSASKLSSPPGHQCSGWVLASWGWLVMKREDDSSAKIPVFHCSDSADIKANLSSDGWSGCLQWPSELWSDRRVLKQLSRLKNTPFLSDDWRCIINKFSWPTESGVGMTSADSLCLCLLTYFSVIFFPVLFRHNWHINYKFKVYNVLIWYTYMLGHDYHYSISWHPHHLT